MKLTSLTIDQFQRLYQIESSRVLPLGQKKAAAIAIVHNKSTDEVAAMKVTEINRLYKQIEKDLAGMPNMKVKRNIKAGDKRYRLTMYTDGLKGGQLIDFLMFNFKDEREVVQNLHRVMATLSCERKWFWTKKYSAKDHTERAEHLRLNAKIGDVWGLCSFFLLDSKSYLKIMQNYLQHLTMSQTTDKASA